jgi:hypothetical protein
MCRWLSAPSAFRSPTNIGGAKLGRAYGCPVDEDDANREERLTTVVRTLPHVKHRTGMIIPSQVVLGFVRGVWVQEWETRCVVSTGPCMYILCPPCLSATVVWCRSGVACGPHDLTQPDDAVHTL